MRITAIYTHPIKGGHRLEHDRAVVEPQGLAGDRRWMIVDDDGVGITQRDDPRLTQLRVRPRPGGLVLSAPGRPDLDVAEPVDQPDEVVRVFRSHDKVPARIAESRWTSEFLGRPARLAWQADPTGRTIPDRAGDDRAGDDRAGDDQAGDDQVSLADGYPLLLANTASLDAVNDWLLEAGDEPVPMTRFRPNVVVTGAPAWAEDDWAGRRLRIGEVTFRAADGCARCVVTTIDQETGERTGQPLKMLGRHRRYDAGLLFALNLIPERPLGVLKIGDPVSVE
jgi:uncharacterized protein YcbX